MYSNKFNRSSLERLWLQFNLFNRPEKIISSNKNVLQLRNPSVLLDILIPKTLLEFWKNSKAMGILFSKNPRRNVIEKDLF